MFDGVVAVDAGVDHLFRHAGVEPDQVRDLVYGAIFTRGGDDLRHTAIFVGGSDVVAAEKLLDAVRGTFFGPMRVSVMLDPNGANTTAAAAVLAAGRHASLSGAEALVLAATGPVGSRVVRLLAAEGGNVRVASRTLERARKVCADVAARVPNARLTPLAVQSDADTRKALEGAQIVIAAGAPGAQLVSDDQRRAAKGLAVAIDLNAVPPLGIEGIKVTDAAKERDGMVSYGAIGVGGTKMKIHKAAIDRLFSASDQVLDAEEIYRIGKELA